MQTKQLFGGILLAAGAMTTQAEAQQFLFSGYSTTAGGVYAYAYGSEPSPSQYDYAYGYGPVSGAINVPTGTGSFAVTANGVSANMATAQAGNYAGAYTYVLGATLDFATDVVITWDLSGLVPTDFAYVGFTQVGDTTLTGFDSITSFPTTTGSITFPVPAGQPLILVAGVGSDNSASPFDASVSLELVENALAFVDLDKDGDADLDDILIFFGKFATAAMGG